MAEIITTIIDPRVRIVSTNFQASTSFFLFEIKEEKTGINAADNAPNINKL